MEPVVAIGNFQSIISLHSLQNGASSSDQSPRAYKALLSWQGEGEGGRGNCPIPLNVGLSENFLLV